MDIYQIAYMSIRESIRKDFWQGILKLYILHQVSQYPIYGNKLRKQLQEMGYDISPGTLYPILHNFENDGLCKSRIKIFKGRARKYYQITEQGKNFLEEMQTKITAILKYLIINHTEEKKDSEIMESIDFSNNS